MKTTERCVLFLLASLILCGCAPLVRVGPIDDLSAGYRKSINISIDPRSSNILADKMIYRIGEVEGVVSTKVGDAGWFDVYASNILLPGSEYLNKYDNIKFDYLLTYRRLPYLWKETIRLQEHDIVGAKARFIVRNAPSCLLLGEEGAAELLLDPAPAIDLFSVTLQGISGDALGVSLVSTGSVNSSTIKFARIKAQQLGTFHWRLIGRDRADILPSEPWITNVLPAISPPSKLESIIGVYRPPDDEGTEGQEVPTSPSKSRNIELHWQNAVGAQRATVRVFEVDARLPAQESLLNAPAGIYETNLQVGKSYFWEVRSEFTTCTQTKWSSYSRSDPFLVPE